MRFLKNPDFDVVLSHAKFLASEALLELLPISFYWLDRSGILQGCNQKVLDDLNISSMKEFVGKHALEIVNQEAWLNSKKSMDNSITLKAEECHTKENGEKIFYLSIKSPMHDKDNKVIGLVGISIDITEQKSIEELKIEKSEAQQAQKDAEEYAAKMKAMAASVAHELRTPLLSINSSALALNTYLPDLLKTYEVAQNANLNIPFITPDIFKGVSNLSKKITDEVSGINLLIEVILANLRDDNFSNESREDCEIQTEVNTALSRFPLTETQRKIIHIDFSNAFIYRGSRELFEHVIFNLLKNALYFIGEAHKGEIYIWTESKEYFNELHFKDTGAGISPEVLPHIFERFFSKTYHGTGVGLTYCKMVMKSFGGDITCESKQGEYTKFLMKFPTVSQK